MDKESPPFWRGCHEPRHCSLDGALTVLYQRIGAQALLKAFNNNFLLLAFAFLAVTWVILLMRRPQRGGAADVSAH